MVNCKFFSKKSAKDTKLMDVQKLPVTSETNFDTSFERELDTEVMKQILITTCENYFYS